MKTQQGQNIVEYILLVVAAILVFLVILNPRSGPLKSSVERTLNSATDNLKQLSDNANINAIRF